jgi:2-oxoacid:acceptor oxidoreductase delta subunit (pyruvate/2-ketoisovalerate family)
VSSLSPWQALPHAGAVEAETAARPETGGWRTGVKPQVELSSCVNCLLCWIYCPDSAIKLDGTTFDGFDLAHCKGCEICAEICPVGAITMAPEERAS